MKNGINTTEDDEVKRMLMEQLEEDASIDVEEVIKYPPVAISCGIYQDRNFDGSYTEYPVPIGTDGNFSFVQAFPKVGKSFFMSLLVSAYQSGSNGYTGKIKGHRRGRKIIHFDTEQGKFHVSKLARRPLVMNDLQNDKDYHIYFLDMIRHHVYKDFDDRKIIRDNPIVLENIDNMDNQKRHTYTKQNQVTENTFKLYDWGDGMYKKETN